MNIPRPQTLRKYGLTEQDFIELYHLQGGKCPICGNGLTKRINIDHWHRQGWKKLKPEKRKIYVRGLVCWFCNHYYLGRSINVQRARNVVNYLEKFEEKINGKVENL